MNEAAVMDINYSNGSLTRFSYYELGLINYKDADIRRIDGKFVLD